MIRPTLSLLSAVSLLVLSACSGPSGLIASGAILVDAGPDRQTGFPIGNEMRLEDPTASADLGRLTGSCEMRELATVDGVRHYGVAVAIQAATEDLGLSSISILHRTDAGPDGAVVDITLGATPMSGQDGACSVELTHAIPGGGLVGLAGACTVEDSASATAEVDIDLTLSGCDVIPAGG